MSKKLKILFDANPIAISGKSGVGHYSSYLVQSLADSFPDELQLIGHYYNFLGRKKISGLPHSKNIEYHPTYLFPGKVANLLRRLGLPLPFELLVKRRGDILLFPNFLTLPSLFKSRTIVTIHDLCFIAHPDFVSERNLHDLQKYVPRAIEQSSLVLTVSEFSKQELERVYGIPANNIVVTPVPPLEKVSVKNGKAILEKQLGISGNFILFVGNLEPRKNLERLVEAYALLPENIRTHYSLVLAGGKGWKNEDLLAQITALQEQGLHIVLPGYISDEQKAALYVAASLVVLPSHYEGFGMPVLEAFQYGAPVAVSDIPVLREVAEEAGVYFDPLDSPAIAQAMEKALTDDSLREKLVAREPGILAKYSWADTAKTLYTKCKELTDENRR